jgi:hypothetical protein
MRLCAIIVIVCSLLSVGLSARADDAADDQTAKAAFEEGRRNFHETGDYEAALAAFRTTQRLRPHDLVRIAIARCLEKLDRHRESLEEWESVSVSAQISAAQKRKVEQALVRLKPMLGTLRVAGEPAGAQVMIDGALRCELPCRTFVDAGEHVVVVQNGQRQRSERLMFSAGQERTIEASLRSGSASQPPLPSSSAPGAAEPTTPAPTPDAPATSRGPGVLLWLGVAVAVVGVAGVVGFGLHADATHADYLATPTDELRDEGLLARDLSNASIGVAGVGAVMVLVDLIFLAPTPESDARLDARGVRVTF